MESQIERRPRMSSVDALRFETPLYTLSEAASIVGVPTSTLTTWAQGYTRKSRNRSTVSGDPVISYIEPVRHKAPSIPFVGLAEALVLAAVRRSGVPMQRIRPALDAIQREMGIDHALASKKLFTDGAELLFDFGRQHDEAADATRHLVVIRNGQRVFSEVVDEYLRRITYGPNGYAELIRVPTYATAEVVADPTRAFGAPIFERGGARVSDVLQRFWAGESLDELVEEYGVPATQLEDVVRVASRRAA
jgi:uncharacterized protein (DUF433 family)